MKRCFIFTLILVAIAVLVGGGMMGSVTAQEADNESVSQADVEEIIDVIESESEADTLANQQRIRLTPQLEIIGWEFVDGQVRLGVETGHPEMVTISDSVAGVGDAGATRVPAINHRVWTGEPTVIVMPVESFGGGHAVTVSAGGESVRLSTDMDTEGDDPLNHFGGHSGLFSGILMTILLSLGGAGFVIWNEQSGAQKA